MRTNMNIRRIQDTRNTIIDNTTNIIMEHILADKSNINFLTELKLFYN